MEEAIIENCFTSAHADIDWTPETSYDADLRHILQLPNVSPSPAESPLCCTAVSWSLTGRHSCTVALITAAVSPFIRASLSAGLPEVQVKA